LYIADYGIHGIEPELSGFELSTWVQMKQMIDNTMPKKNKSPVGKKGAPFGNSNAKKQTQNNSNQKTNKTMQSIQKQIQNNWPNINVNENGNVNGNDKFPSPETETLPGQQTFPTADAVDPVESPSFAPQKAEPPPDDTRSDPPQPAYSDAGVVHAAHPPPENNAIVPKAASPPSKKSKKRELSPEQMTLVRAAKACFETSQKAKALIYQDKQSTAREMQSIKTLVVRCQNMAPELSADFLQNVLEQFRVMTNGKLKGKAVFTPRVLITPWIWELVIDSLPENDVSPDLRETIRSLFT
jgi:hypothetical protein